MLAEELRTQLKQTFVIENKPGAATAIAASAVSKSAPDGYTIMMGSSTTLAMNPSLYNKLTYDPERSCADRACWRGLFRAGGKSVRTGQNAPGVDRLHQKQTGRTEFRHIRRGHAASPVHGNVHEHDRHKDAACSLQGQRSGAHGRSVRTNPADDRRPDAGAAAHSGRQDPRVRVDGQLHASRPRRKFRRWPKLDCRATRGKAGSDS